MKTTAQELYARLEKGAESPICVVVGDESFQAADIEERFRLTHLRGETDAEFNLEIWDGNQLDADRLVSSLQTLPGLFSGIDSHRLIIVRQFEKAPVSAMETLEGYCRDPSPDSRLIIFTAKADRRRSLYRLLEAEADWIEIREPYDREWPKWQPYFERKCGRKIDQEAWEMLVLSQRSLSLVWSEVQKLVVYTSGAIKRADVLAFAGGVSGVDVFSFVDDVLFGRAKPAMEKLHHLLLSGESEIKLLSLLVRQMRRVDQVKRLPKAADPQAIATQIGVPRFAVQTLMQQEKRFTEKELRNYLTRLADTDYRMKLGQGGLFENYLANYFNTSTSTGKAPGTR